jgi:hypothetical protein
VPAARRAGQEGNEDCTWPDGTPPAFSPRRPRLLSLPEGFELASHLALAFIPAAGRCGRWDHAARAAQAFLGLVSFPSPPASQRAGSPVRVRSLQVLVAPVLWALALAHPSLPRRIPVHCRIDGRAWAEAAATSALFTGLKSVPALLPSVQVAAGVLAAVARPAHADAWIRAARRVAAGSQADAVAALLNGILEARTKREGRP